MTGALLILANALLLFIALLILFDLLDRKWSAVQGAWLRIRRRLFGR